MFNGTTIDDLLNIVARAEEHAREVVVEKVEVKPTQVIPAFLYEIPSQQNWYGVA